MSAVKKGARALFQTPSGTIASLRYTPRADSPGLTPILSQEGPSGEEDRPPPSAAAPGTGAGEGTTPTCFQRLQSDGAATTGGKSVTGLKKNLLFSSPNDDQQMLSPPDQKQAKTQKGLDFEEAKPSPPMTRSLSKKLQLKGQPPLKHKTRNSKKVSFGAPVKFNLSERRKSLQEDPSISVSQFPEDDDDKHPGTPPAPGPPSRRRRPGQAAAAAAAANGARGRKRPAAGGGEGAAEAAEDAAAAGAEEAAAAAARGGEPDPEPPAPLRQLLAVCGHAYHALALYRAEAAEAWLGALPAAQAATGWACHQRGRAALLQGRWAAAARRLRAARRAPEGGAGAAKAGWAPLSTALWQLRDAPGLAALARRALAEDRAHPGAWCAAGNALSLQRDPEGALRAFGRARRLAPRDPYPWALSGHERAARDAAPEGAEAAYRKALELDPRCFTAWCGLGQLYQRVERPELAEFHFRRALLLHPRSAPALCLLAAALAQGGRPEEAVAALGRAIALGDPHPDGGGGGGGPGRAAAQARWQRAQLLAGLGRWAGARADLLAARAAAPRDPEVWALLGRALARLGGDHAAEACRCLATARDLGPKDPHAVKAELEQLDQSEVEEEDIHY